MSEFTEDSSPVAYQELNGYLSDCHLLEVSMAVLQLYCNEMTCHEIIHRAVQLSLVKESEVSPRHLFRVIRRCWLDQDGVFYIRLKSLVGLQTWRRSAEKALIYDMLRSKGSDMYPMFEVFLLVRQSGSHLPEQEVFDLLGQLVEDGLLLRDRTGAYVVKEVEYRDTER